MKYGMFSKQKCRICGKLFEMSKGQPIYAGIGQYCPECLTKHRNSDGSMPGGLDKF